MRKIILFIFAFCMFSKAFSQDSIPDYGIFGGFSMGTTYLSTSKNNILEVPFLLGFSVEFRGKKSFYSFTFDLIKPTVENYVPLEYEGKSIMVKNGGGAQVTLDYSRDFWQKNKFLLSGICGTGYKGISYSEEKEEKEIDKEGWILTPGVRVSYFGKIYLELRMQYVINYHFKDNANSNLEGNYFMTKLVFGN